VTRWNRGPLAVGGLAVAGALTATLLSACGAGQIAQTAGIQPGVPGVNAQAPGRLVFVRNATVDYAGPKGYPKGASAPLSFWVFNDGQEPVNLVGVTAAQVTLDGRALPVQVTALSGTASASPCVSPRSPSAGPLPGVSASASPLPSTSGPAKPSGSASASASPSPSASPSASPSPTRATSFTMTIPSSGCVELSARAAQYLQVGALPEPLGNQQAVRAVFQFTASDGQSFTIGDQNPPLDLPVAPPSSALPRPSAT